MGWRLLRGFERLSNPKVKSHLGLEFFFPDEWISKSQKGTGHGGGGAEAEREGREELGGHAHTCPRRLLQVPLAGPGRGLADTQSKWSWTWFLELSLNHFRAKACRLKAFPGESPSEKEGQGQRSKCLLPVAGSAVLGGGSWGLAGCGEMEGLGFSGEHAPRYSNCGALGTSINDRYLGGSVSSIFEA